ncbi:MAG TPA: 3-hydroxyacyl-CoA dehydrogenase PaaH [Azospirillum sp.]|nr:3-hydroxyacyl-CoA dehydrogenase PaaH [Azospirillum sp.]
MQTDSGTTRSDPVALPGSAIVAVIGAGTMGSGIAQVAATAGHTVLLYDSAPDAVGRGLSVITGALDRAVAKGQLAEEARATIVGRLHPCSDLAELAGVDLAVEAIVEDLAVKQALFTRLEAVVSDRCILATNTSSISIESIGAPLARPGRFAGLHFFNPAPVMALVEIVSGRATDPDVAACLHATAAAWGKVPVHARSTPGFIVNRVARPFYAEALRVLAEGGADPATVDAVVRECGGFRMGPCELMDLIGHDVNYAVTRSVWEAFHFDPRFQPSLVQRALVEARWLGRKTGRGFYDYQGGAKTEPANAAPAPAPGSVALTGSLGPAAALVPLLRDAGIAVEEVSGPGGLRVGRALLAPTDGRLATERASEESAEVILFDWALDYAAAKRIALAPAQQTSPEALVQSVGLFQALGKEVSVIGDVPGMVVARTVAMLANEAADALNQQVADAAAIDLAMRKGVNYPVGPLSWADRIGPRYVLHLLDNLARTYGEDRYRASPLLRKCALSGRGLSSME